MAQAEVAEADLLQQFQAFYGALGEAGIGEAGEEGDDFFDGGVQNVGDGEGA